MNRTLVSLVTAIAATGLTAGAAAQEAMPTPIVEIFACNYNNNSDMDDVRAVATRWTSWADRNNVRDYTAFLATPYLYSPDFTYDVMWLGAWPSGTAMGAGEALWMRTGQEINAQFASVVDCPAHALYAEVVTQAPQGPPPENGVAEFSDCKVREGRTVPEALDAIGQVNQYFAGRGASPFVAALFPLAGQTGDADFAFKLVIGYDNIEAYGRLTDLYTDGGFMRVDELTGRVLDCNSPRVYTLELVRAAAQP